MNQPERLITEHLDIWTSAIEQKSTKGRGSNSKINLYGIKKLRELILELAVRGLLVPQDPNDEPASVLLERIKAEKERLVKEGKVKKQKALSPISEEEKTFELPEGWEWVKLGDLMEMYNGRAFKSTEWNERGSPIVRIQNLNDLSAPFNYYEGDVSDHHKIRNGSFLISWSGTPGTSFGAFVWSRGSAVLNQHINNCIFHIENMNLEFMRLAVNGCMNHLISMAQGGVGLKHVTKGTLNNTVLALPPNSEQSRITSSFNKLMTICDQLEQETTTKIEAHQTLVETLLNALTNAADKGEFDEAWGRVVEHFDMLFTTEHSVDLLKQTILQLAVMGKLVRQDPNDEPASVLLERIKAEKERLVKEGKIKKQKALPPISEEEKPFELPEGWEWVRISNLSLVGTGSTPSRDNSSYYNPAEYSWVTSGETSQDFIYETKEKVSKKALNETNISLYPVGTLIIAMYGQGKTRGQITELMIEAGTNQACAAIQLIDNSKPHRQYIKIFFQKAYDELRSNASGGAQPNLNVKKVSTTVVPLAPEFEQARIVVKVNDLMKLCDKLKVGIKATKVIKSHLANVMAEEVI